MTAVQKGRNLKVMKTYSSTVAVHIMATDQNINTAVRSKNIEGLIH